VSDHEIEPHQTSAADPVRPGAAWVQSFNDRYGVEAYRILLDALEKPCVSYAETAARFGVTRERVRQWHLLLMPDAPRGHERRRLCRSYHQKRQLLIDPLFRAFVRAARPSFPSQSIGPIPARDGFRRRTVRLETQTVVLKQAARAHPREGSQPRVPAYALTSSRGNADFIFYQLSGDDYLFVPKTLIPLAGTTFLDTSASKYRQFKNTFQAAASLQREGDALGSATIRAQVG
jgi:hypothetical protein